MSRPPLLVRVAGSPLPALLLFVAYAAVIAGWYEGHVVWWQALAAVGATCLRTLSAVGQVMAPVTRRLARGMERDGRTRLSPHPGPKRKNAADDGASLSPAPRCSCSRFRRVFSIWSSEQSGRRSLPWRLNCCGGWPASVHLGVSQSRFGA